jgi:hypothetical protein
MNINNELGISSQTNYYSDMAYANAGGKGWRKVGKITWIVLSPVTYAGYNALKNNDKKRYKEVMGSASNPQSDKIKHFDNDIVKQKFPFDSKMSTEKLADIIDEMNNEYNRYDTDRDSKAAAVAKNNKKFSVEPNRGLIAQLQDIRAMMQAINDHRARVVKAYDIAVAREEKEFKLAEEKALAQGRATQVGTTTGGTTTGGTPSGSIISGGGLSSIMSNEQATGTTTTGSDELQPSDKQKKTLVFIVGGLVVLGAGYYFLTKK